MGLSSARDEFNLWGDEALAGIDNMEKVVDDIILYDSSMHLHEQNFHYGQTEVKFAGFRVTSQGIQADPEKIKAIAQFPKPKNISDLCSFLGLVKQLAGFSDTVSAKFMPLRPLPQPQKSIHLDRGSPQGLRRSQKKDEQDVWKLIECGSRFVTETEARYAMVELELLAAVWALRKCHSYLFGLPEFTLITDHQPLRLKSYLTPYDFKTVWKRGKDNGMADALSRSPVDKPTQGDDDFTQDMYGSIHTITANLLDTLNNSDISQIECDPITLESIARDPILEEIAEASRNDPIFRLLKDNILGKMDKHNINPSLISSLLHHIATFGRLLRIFSDGGLQFTAAETHNFFARWGGALELRNTPLRHGSLSPSQIVFGRPMRSRLPARNLSLAEDWQERLNEHDRHIAKQHEYAKNHYNKTSNELKPIPIGSKVWIQDPTSKIWDQTATVQGKKQDREYLLLLPSGRTLCRNRCFIRILRTREDIITTPQCESTLKDNSQTDEPSNLQRPKRLRFAPIKFTPSD
ncbi:unnamed protein product [Lepeophtheirus salmonis]|uniref:(salmon louse) hypothetical protein n=1 Tax=Lepeophtheirus salmonis TaxID=72036 RepID=A0A7R8CHA8_LEPSM|nr:unnamed protein product [Lepeophtheirus salmonis]CAF2818696.1 unnamed protein product [Lepeophtheirus salmonis]